MRFDFYPSFLLLFIFCPSILLSQIGIGTTEPNPNAILDITSTAESPGGLLLPRVELLHVTSPSPLEEHVEGMVVYNTREDEDLSAGFYYNDGEIWVEIGATVPSFEESWSTIGNTDTDPDIHFLGTINNQPLRIRTNDIFQFEITTSGKLRAANNGSQEAPTYSWTQGEDTGIFSPENKSIGFSTGGKERFRIPNADQVHAMSFGSAEQPFYSWANNEGTGIWKPGDPEEDNLGFSTNGIERFRMNSEGQLLRVDQDSRSRPSYTWAQSPTTGMFLPDEDAIGFSTGGEERVRIPNGNQLFAMSAGTEERPFYSWFQNPGTGIWQNGSNNLSFSTAENERIRITSNGQMLHVGTSSPRSPSFSWDSSKRTGMFSPSENHIGFSTNGQERIRIPDEFQILAMANGTENLPFYTWEDDRGTGIFKSGSVNLGFSTDSKERFRMTDKGQILKIDDSAHPESENHPAYSWKDHPDTGMFLSEDNSLGFTTAGVERFRIPRENQVLAMASGTEEKPFYSWLNFDGTGIWKPDDHDGENMAFSTDGLERMRIRYDGKVLINMTDTDESGILQVKGEQGEPAIRAMGVNGSVAIRAVSVINGVSTGLAAEFLGDVYVLGNITSGSDRRFKKNISRLNTDNELMKKVMNLKPSSYRWRHEEFPHLASFGDKKSFGFIAQELQEVFPELVKSLPLTDTGQNSPRGEYLSINYIGLIPVLTEAIQEQQKIIEDHEKRITELEAIIELLSQE